MFYSKIAKMLFWSIPMKSEKISIVIPCYNESDVVSETYWHIKKILDSESLQNYELIFVDDGSLDPTFKILNDLSIKDRSVKIISFSRNFGHEAAVTAGLNNTDGDLIFILDADLQDPPELMPDMIKILKNENADMVYGVRKVRKGETFFKKTSSKFFYRLLNYFSDVKLPLDTGDFRLINQKIVMEYRKLNEKNKYTRGLISWIGFKQVPMFYERQPRFSGTTKYNFRRLSRLASNAIFYFSKKPLMLAINLGFLSVIFCLLFSIYVFWGKFVKPLPGWASTLLIIIFFGGIQLLTIGVLGLYLGNIFDEVKNRPEYIIDKKINFGGFG
jgi:glycosyltransferase involved in cell wall biosynthesis